MALSGKIIFAALVIAGAVIFAFNVKVERNNQELVIKDSESGRIYGSWHVEDGGEFVIEYVHSVNQSPVRETFLIEENIIRLLNMRFYSFGAGIEAVLEEGQELIRDGDAMLITGFDRSFRELRYIVGTVSDHLLFINDDVYSLRDLCGRNARVTIGLR